MAQQPFKPVNQAARANLLAREEEQRQAYGRWRDDEAARLAELERWARDLQTDLAKAGILVLRPIILAD